MKRCSECGNDLTAAGAVQAGHVPAKPRYVFVGMLIAASGASIPVINTWIDSVDWNRYKSVETLLTDIEQRARRYVSITGHCSIYTLSNPHQELTRRIRGGLLDGSEIKTITRRALPPHAAGSDEKSAREAEWEYQVWWAGLLNELYQQNHVTQKQLLAYVKAAWEKGCALSVTPKSKSDDGWQLHISIEGGPAGIQTSFPIGYVWEISHVRLNGEPYELSRIQRYQYAQMFHSPFVGKKFLKRTIPLEPGEHTLTMALKFRFVEDKAFVSRLNEQVRRNGREFDFRPVRNWFVFRTDPPINEPLMEWTEHLSATFTIED